MRPRTIALGRFLILTASFCILCLIILLLLQDRQVAIAHPQTETQGLVVSYQLPVPFHVLGGRIVLARPAALAGALPVEDGEHLYLLTHGRFQHISDLQQLAGRVHIATPDQALAFVRLFTSRRTYLAFSSSPPKHSWQADAPPLVDPDASVHLQYQSELMLPKITCTRNGYHFVIRRPLLMEDRGREHFDHVVFVTEEVTPQGRYKLISQKNLGAAEAFGYSSLMPGLM